MSHLPLDARAILDYLNELGYRNISAEQLKEFMKGMQSQSEIYKSKLKEKNSISQQQQQQQRQQQQQSQTREQHRQQQQQQRQQSLQSTTSATTKATTAEGSEVAVDGLGKSPPVPQRRATVKVIKCKKPLCHFKFYLDICDHQLTKRIEEQIRTLGGALEFFLTSSVTHFITDKAILPPTVANNSNNNNSFSSRPGTPQTPGTPNTPQTPYTFDTQDGKNNASGGSNTPTGSARKFNTRQTRANAILNRVRRASTTNAINVSVVSVSEPPNSPAAPVSLKDVGNQSQSPYIVWQTEYALHFFKKVQHELKDYLSGHSRHDHQKLLSKGRNSVDPIDLKGGGFIKIEAIKRNYRPYYQLFRKSSGTEWPKIELTREDGAFRLSPKKKIAPSVEVTADTHEREKEKAKAKAKDNEEQKMTRKSRSRSSQHQRPLPAAVQSLKKGDGGGGTGGAADSAATVKSSQRNSHAGAAAGTVAAGCKQVKESSEKQCGVCEICKIEYDTLTIHLKTKDHEYFAKNSQNFIALDSLIHTSADVNKFLNEDKKVDLEEMEVENIGVVADENEPDPLEGSEPLMCVPGVLELIEDKRRMSGGVVQTPSPTLREKSKRSTKGKHSSEKFQNLRLSKSPKATATAMKSQTSPLKQQMAPTTATTSSMLELQRIETCTTATAKSSTKATSLRTAPSAVMSATAPMRRKPTSTAAVSPPIRAMLPPSSLYKVVGTPETVCTPVRKPRSDLPTGDDQPVTASPSLIVKFKKVRATELHRLNGEAESFMFPKQRTSSELPTDVDRQTTSDNARASFSSTSLDSTSDGPMDVELSAPTAKDDDKSAEGKHAGKRATVTAKRRKGQTTAASKQRFRNAPIQPEIQLKDKQVSRNSASIKPTTGNVTDTARSAISAAAAKANAAAAALAAITLPEATRKSSRTATAIVTAATTSSRLLRAAVEAAKHNCRQMAAANELLGSTNKKCYANEVMTKLLPAAATVVPKGRKRVAVVKMEDRMGDTGDDKKCRDLKKVESESEDKECEDDDGNTCVINGTKAVVGDPGIGKKSCVDFDDDEEDEDDDEEVDNDDEKDEDYVHCKSRRRKSVSFESYAAVWQSSLSGAVSRKQRAAQREEQKSKLAMLASQQSGNNSATKNTGDAGQGGKRKKFNELQSNAKQLIITASANNSKINKPSAATCVTPTTSPPKQRSTALSSFDYASSEQIKRMRYSFERIPVSDLWYRVFARQDSCSEQFFEYYGSTNYRKLPYELGPIPFVRTLDRGVCCKLCEKQRSTDFPSKEVTKSFPTTQSTCKVKTEPLEETEDVATKSRDSSSGSSNNIANAMGTSASKAIDVQSDQATTHFSAASAATQYKHKHKKLQILQRYRQEQQELQKRQAAQASAQMGSSSNHLQCDSKTSTPAQEPVRDRQRAGSTHSTTSSTSCASSTATTKTSKNRYLNKHLNKAAAAFLNLELPPRKSPREHASTLALVSCIIKQRQDSQSKPNSETDEPSITSTHTPLSVSETTGNTKVTINSATTTATQKQAIPAAATTAIETPGVAIGSTPNADQPAVLRSPRHTRSAAATPVEELRFTTEISENVKRMRRGQNKYDHSPPVPLNQAPKSRKSTRGGRQSVKSPLGRPPRAYYGLKKFLHTTGRSTNRRSHTPNALAAMSTPAKRHRRVKHAAGFATAFSGARRHHSYKGLIAPGSALPSIRKTGSKKGVLEFEVDETALKALDAATKHTNMRLLEWQIDKYLQLYGSEYDLAGNSSMDICEGGETVPLATTAITSTTKTNRSLTSSTAASTSKASRRVSSANADAKRNSSASTAPFDSNTPPPTDCFSSDFDLYDLFTNTMGANASEDEQTADVGNKRKSGSFSLYSSIAMQNYFRKRKNLKSNRTGWPKVQKKKSSARQQQKLEQKIRFLQDIGELESNGIKEEPDAEEESREGVVDQADDTAEQCKEAQRRRGNGFITPPESETEVKLYGKRTMQNNGDEGGSGEADDDTEMDAGESIPEEEDREDDDDDDGDEEEDAEDDGETVADSIEEEEGVPRVEGDADAAVEADEEDELDGDLDADAVAEDEDDVMNEDSNFAPALKRTRHRTNASPLEEKQVTSNSLTAHSANSNNTAATSTPSTQMLRGGLRRTPQLLNGSLGSCISPSEKAGDNSDIFTVSSDGLDTDLDMSNSQHKCDDEHLHHHHHHHHHHLQHQHQDQCANHQTPKRKFDLSKYAPNNATSSSCAAEAATAAVKSLAISQFLKKEVRVTCRRLRAPFRRYRYRR